MDDPTRADPGRDVPFVDAVMRRVQDRPLPERAPMRLLACTGLAVAGAVTLVLPGATDACRAMTHGFDAAWLVAVPGIALVLGLLYARRRT